MRLINALINLLFILICSRNIYAKMCTCKLRLRIYLECLVKWCWPIPVISSILSIYFFSMIQRFFPNLVQFYVSQWIPKMYNINNYLPPSNLIRFISKLVKLNWNHGHKFSEKAILKKSRFLFIQPPCFTIHCAQSSLSRDILESAARWLMTLMFPLRQSHIDHMHPWLPTRWRWQHFPGYRAVSYKI